MAGPEQLGTNEEAVRALVAMHGGAEGLLTSGLRLGQLAEVLKADPDDDLSGLRLLASRMELGPGLMDVDGSAVEFDTEIPVSPDQARAWLISTGRVTDDSLTPTEKLDHLGMAGLVIASGNSPRLMTQVYAEVTDNRSPLSPTVVKNISRLIVGD